MSWLSGITEKAGDLLTKLDKSAADVFNNDDENPNLPPQLDQSYHGGSISDHTGVGHSTVTQQDSGLSSSLTTSASVPANLHQMKQTHGNPSSSFVSSPIPKTTSATQESNTSSPKTNIPNKSSLKDSDDALFEFLNSNETAGGGNSKKKAQTPPQTRRKHSRQSSASSTVSNKNGIQMKTIDTLEDTAKLMEQSVVSQMTASATSVDDLNLDLPDEMSASRTSSHHSDEADPSEKQLSALELENRLLRNEIASLNEEMATVIQRAKDSRQEVTNLKVNMDQYNNTASRGDQIIRELQARETDLTEALAAKDAQLAVLRVRLEEADQERKVKEQDMNILRVERERVLKDHTDSSGVHSQALDSVRVRLNETEAALKREQDAFKIAQNEATRRQSQLESEIQTMVQSLSAAQKKGSTDMNKTSELYSQIKTTKASLDAARQELSDYKDKASRILQSKERLIASLREGPGASGEAVGVSSLEYDAVKQERDMFREELQQNKMTMENLRVEIQDAETQLQQDNDTAQEQLRSLDDQLSGEKRRREETENELLKQKQELQYSLEELHRQKVAMTTQVSDREKEINKLRTQLTTKKLGSTTENELESRVKMLTESLIQKQTVLESLSTEKNSLSLQLERLEYPCYWEACSDVCTSIQLLARHVIGHVSGGQLCQWTGCAYHSTNAEYLEVHVLQHIYRNETYANDFNSIDQWAEQLPSGSYHQIYTDLSLCPPTLQQYRDVQASAVRSSSAIVNVNEDDEIVRQRLPAFMREGPSDTNVTRKMKRAAKGIDKFSIRLGVFLRRYPIARVFVIMYMALLHLWVTFVLLTYQPEIHGTHSISAQPKPPEP